MLFRSDGVDLWLSSYPGYQAPYYTGTVRVYWNSTSSCSGNPPAPAAIEVVLISGPAAPNTLTSPVTTRFAADACGTRNTNSNHFTTAVIVSGAPFTVDGKPGFQHAIDVAMPAGNTNGIIARIIPLYANTIVGVSGPTNFPQQGTVVSSTGSSGETRRKITVFQGYPKIPNEFFSFRTPTPMLPAS